MERKAQYLIFQHIADLLRHESRNVGVLVRLGDRTAARFFGEKLPGDFDGRKIKAMPHPNSYMEWVGYWRRTLMGDPETAWREIQENTDGNYRARYAGELSNIGDDAIDDVLNYAYSLLVSEGRLAEALGGPDEAEAAAKLGDVIGLELKRMNLLLEGDGLFNQYKHPIVRNAPVAGKSADHIFSFVQRNGHPVVMEPIDLTVRRDKRRMTERAGWISRVFQDVREKEPDAETIAIYSATAQEEKDEAAEYALRLLHDDVTERVNWQSEQDRNGFIAARAALAAAE